MNVSLTQELEELVTRKVKSGLYHTASEVIRDALRLLEERDRLYALRLEELRGEVKKGVDQLDRGEGRPLRVAALKKRFRTEAAQRAKQARRRAVQQSTR
jgi:antitoxin ParD1/3/4